MDNRKEYFKLKKARIILESNNEAMKSEFINLESTAKNTRKIVNILTFWTFVVIVIGVIKAVTYFM